MMLQASQLVLISLLALPLGIQAEEVDDFTIPSKTPKDSAAAINAAVNDQMSRVVQTLNTSTNPTCERSKIIEKFLYALDTNFSALGNALRIKSYESNHPGWVTQDIRSIDIESVELTGASDQARTIYHDANIRGCCVQRLNINGIIVGLDKVDHFLGNGGDLWKVYEESKNDQKPATDSDILKMCVHEEHAGWGLGGTHVKSYAISDLALEVVEPKEKTERTTALRSGSEKAPSKSRYIPNKIKLEVWKKANSQCQFISPETQRKCNSTHRLQIEHKIPYSIGGTHEIENLSLLCAAHNAHMAIELLGEKKMNLYLRKS